MSNFGVKVWQEWVSIPTYGIGAPDKNPMFFEKRVYQGSSGVVYPNAVIEKIFDEKQDKAYNALFIENQYLKIMVLPELGGRIQMAYDKISQRNFIYYNQVIKPALVGLTGPWISGGIEFNWPQHHRPSTFEPVDHTVTENADGSKTVWVNEVERMFGTKGMAGFTLHPNKAYIEIKAKLFNRTPLPQTFLWWANPAVKVNDDYQSVFPPDVNAVFDHGKRDVSTFPIATGTYYKVDYSPGTDISRYKNIPVPTSYMAINSAYDFVGGYEHDTQAGVLHVANHHVSPGKKQWTWGHSDFGKAWDRNLTDEDGPYIELMTGVFTDNQPDFSWLMPYEEKSFTQYFLPYRELGMVKNASKDVLLNLDVQGNTATIKIMVTSAQPAANIALTHKGSAIWQHTADLVPESILQTEVPLPPATLENELVLIVNNANGKELLRYEPAQNKQNDIPQPADPALPPHEVESTEQLFLTGQHLEQYRHATYSPVPYYEEALKRDNKDARNNNALGAWYLRRGKFDLAEPYFRQAIATITARNPNPYDGEPYYNLGLCLRFKGQDNEAYDAFYKATWNKAWQDTAYFSVAQIDVSRGDLLLALEHVDNALDRNARNSKAWALKASILRKLNQPEHAILTGIEALERDAFNLGALFEKHLCYLAIGQPQKADADLKELLALSRTTGHNLTEYALDHAAAGMYAEAIHLLSFAATNEASPLVYYHLAYFAHQMNDQQQAHTYLQQAASASSYLCFPNRLTDILALQYAMKHNPTDANAPYYLGNLWYDKRQYADAIACWERSAQLNKCFATVYRNLGIAYFNKQQNSKKALLHFEKAFTLDRNDARVLMELDQLYKRLNKPAPERLKFLEANLLVAIQRDDLYLERVALYNYLGNFKKAHELMMGRQFHPWEGGEGKVSGQYVYNLTEQAKQQIHAGKFARTIALLQQAQVYPHNLGEGKLFGAQENDIFYWLGMAHEGLGEQEKATAYFKLATQGLSEPGAAMFYNDQQPDKIFYQGLAWKRSGDAEKANAVFNNLVAYGQAHQNDVVKIDYFAVSLPDLLIFEDDLDLRNKIHCYYMMGLGLMGLGKKQEATLVLDKVMGLDAMHFGALTHLNLLMDSKNLISY